MLTNSTSRAYLRGDTHVAVTLFAEVPPARTPLVEDPTSVAAIYQKLIEEAGRTEADRRMGIRINVPRTPGPAGLAEAARRDGLAGIDLYIDGIR